MSAWCPLAILSGDGKPHGQGISAVALEGALHELIINKFNTSEHHREPTFRTGGACVGLLDSIGACWVLAMEAASH
jgi:hypothetical protein